jgi:hypothetical protein
MSDREKEFSMKAQRRLTKFRYLQPFLNLDLRPPFGLFLSTAISCSMLYNI